MSLKLLLLLFFFCILKYSAEAAKNWTCYEQTNSCYMMIDECTFDNCEAECQRLGGHLASIHSAEENKFVNDFATGGQPYFNQGQVIIGLKRTGNQWKWTDGTSVDYTRWAPSQPDNYGGNQACGVTYAESATTCCWPNGPGMKLYAWDDEFCNAKFRAVCKFPKRIIVPETAKWTCYEQTNSCYRMINPCAFDSCEGECKSLGANLASIHSAEENKFINDFASTTLPQFDYGAVTIGLKRIGDQWTWTDGTSLDYNNWAPSQPDNYGGGQGCGITQSNPVISCCWPKGRGMPHYTWDDISCGEEPHAAICKIASSRLVNS